MSRQWFVEGREVYEDSTASYFVEGGEFNEDFTPTPIAGVTDPIIIDFQSDIFSAVDFATNIASIDFASQINQSIDFESNLR